MTTEDIFEGYGVEVKLKTADDFLKTKETLTRIGVASHKEGKKLYQSCHILHKRGRYAIVHFKELFELDGKASSITDEDIARRNKIAKLLEDWGLVTIVEKSKIGDEITTAQIKVIPFKEKSEWELLPKYNIGVKAKPKDTRVFLQD